MSVFELKNDLHRHVVETDDAEFLRLISDLFLAFQKEEDWWLLLSENEQAMLEKSSGQKAAGQGIPHLEVRREIDQLLKRAS